MRITDVYNSKAVAIATSEVASNKIPYLGEGLFPTKKKMGLDLKWIKASKGLPVSLKPSAFDTVSTIRSREGFKVEETEMAFFKESMLVKEKDRQDMMRVQDSADPYAQDILSRIYDDANTLIEGAKVVPERMRMSLLANAQGKPSISFGTVDGATYEYNYDADGSYVANNFSDIGALQATNYWTDTTNSDPMADVANAQDKVEAKTGSRPSILVISKATMNLLKKNDKVKNYILAQNTTATVMVTDERVKAIFSAELGVNIIVYTKLYKDEAGNVKKFYPDGMATLIPTGALGSTWFGTTPDEADLLNKADIDCTVINGVAVTVTTSTDPVQTKTTASEICLPSYERLDETFMLKVEATVAY